MLSRLLKKNTESVPAFTKKPFFRSEEKAFYARLRRTLPKCYVFPDVELRALMTPVSTDPRQRRAEKEYLSGRKVDYAVFDARLSLLCVIELKTGGLIDSTPGSNAELLRSASIRHFCWDKLKLPTSEQMMNMFAPFVMPVAPRSSGSAESDADSPHPNSTFVSVEEVVMPRITSLTVEAVEALAPMNYTKNGYPHVWERICLFCNDPSHLADYIATLSMQNRSVKRVGFPAAVMAEINEIERVNAQFINKAPEKVSWNDVFADR
ncbi:MAG: DUF2726 domain-containing protein [Pseudomonadota bacterium]